MSKQAESGPGVTIALVLGVLGLVVASTSGWTGRALSALGMWPVVGVESVQAVLPEIQGSSGRELEGDERSGTLVTGAGGRALSLSWYGSTEALDGEVDPELAMGHPVELWTELEEGVRMHEASWVCPETQRGFVLVAAGPEAAARKDRQAALELVECHGHGEVRWPRAHWDPPEGWVAEGYEFGFEWFAGPGEHLGLAVTVLELDCELEELASAALNGAPARSLPGECAAEGEGLDEDGERYRFRVEERRCGDFVLQAFRSLDLDAEPIPLDTVDCRL